jgi:hypothetical protein
MGFDITLWTEDESIPEYHYRCDNCHQIFPNGILAVSRHWMECYNISVSEVYMKAKRRQLQGMGSELAIDRGHTIWRQSSRELERITYIPLANGSKFWLTMEEKERFRCFLLEAKDECDRTGADFSEWLMNYVQEKFFTRY